MMFVRSYRILFISCVTILLLGMFVHHATSGIFENIRNFYGVIFYKPPFENYFTPFLLEFIAGAAIYHYKPKSNYGLLWTIVSLIVAIIIEQNYFPDNYITQGYAAFYRVLLFSPFCVFLLISLSQHKHTPTYLHKWFTKIGDASFSLYLWHIPLWFFMSLYNISFMRHQDSWQQIFWFSCVAIIISLIWYYLIEAPIYKYAIFLLDKITMFINQSYYAILPVIALLAGKIAR
jgi:peptidoglycan/LPS O-acetylase OafA/YrhL